MVVSRIELEGKDVGGNLGCSRMQGEEVTAKRRRAGPAESVMLRRKLGVSHVGLSASLTMTLFRRGSCRCWVKKPWLRQDMLRRTS